MSIRITQPNGSSVGIRITWGRTQSTIDPRSALAQPQQTIFHLMAHTLKSGCMTREVVP
jgi:hypothetical protein